MANAGLLSELVEVKLRCLLLYGGYLAVATWLWPDQRRLQLFDSDA